MWEIYFLTTEFCLGLFSLTGSLVVSVLNLTKKKKPILHHHDAVNFSLASCVKAVYFFVFNFANL